MVSARRASRAFAGGFGKESHCGWGWFEVSKRRERRGQERRALLNWSGKKAVLRVSGRKASLNVVSSQN